MSNIGDEVKRLYGEELSEKKLPGKKGKKSVFSFLQNKNVRTLFVVGIIIFVVWHLVMAYGIIYYNQFVTLDQYIKAQTSQIEKEYQRRNDLVPNLIKVARDYAQHERELFHHVSNTRSILESAEKLAKEYELENQAKVKSDIDNVMSKLVALSEQYPDLKATQSFQDLMGMLEDTENRIASMRDKHIAYVMDYNTLVVTFPSSFFNWIYGFEPHDYFASKNAGKPVLDKSDSLLVE
ncbi:MAG: LemA family protein [Fibrobacteria bacterium]|nr:LemA family protein [Fibrobacteria bacterium]